MFLILFCNTQINFQFSFLLAGLVGAGIVIGSAIATQGIYQLNDMYHEQYPHEQ